VCFSEGQNGCDRRYWRVVILACQGATPDMKLPLKATKKQFAAVDDLAIKPAAAFHKLAVTTHSGYYFRMGGDEKTLDEIAISNTVKDL